MRAALTVLLLLFSARQAVAFTDCCCESFCRNPNEPCEGHDHKPSTGECWKDGAPAPAEPKPCTHLAPTSEVVTPDAADAPVVPTAAIALPESPTPPSPFRKPDRPDSYNRGSPPLLLRIHVLLI